MNKSPSSTRKFLFKVILILFLAEVTCYGYFQVDIYLSDKKIEEQKSVLDKQNKELSTSQTMTWHLKLNMVRQIENNYKNIPRSEHIAKVIVMLEDIRDIDTSKNDVIILSDFKVSLNEISLRWQVSRLWLLYYNNQEKGIEALLDKFSALDFLSDIRIKTYEKTEGHSFEFLLEANVINDGK